jgi:hypothetical protein
MSCRRHDVKLASARYFSNYFSLAIKCSEASANKICDKCATKYVNTKLVYEIL